MRDYLNANEEKANEYSDLKIKLADEYPNDRIAYTKGKSKLIEEILNSASMWRKCNDYKCNDWKSISIRLRKCDEVDHLESIIAITRQKMFNEVMLEISQILELGPYDKAYLKQKIGALNELL